MLDAIKKQPKERNKKKALEASGVPPPLLHLRRGWGVLFGLSLGWDRLWKHR